MKYDWAIQLCATYLKEEGVLFILLQCVHFINSVRVIVTILGVDCELMSLEGEEWRTESYDILHNNNTLIIGTCTYHSFRHFTNFRGMFIDD